MESCKMANHSRRIRLILIILLCIILAGLIIGWFVLAPIIIESKANDALKEVAEKTGRHVELSGIHLSGLKSATIGKLTISDVDQPEKTGLAIDDAKITLSSLPFGDFSIASVSVDELNVTVRVSDGKTNFDDLLESLRPKPESTETGPKKPKAWKRYITPFPAIQISSLNVSMPSIHVNDSLEVGDISASDIQVKTDEDGFYLINSNLSAQLVESDTPTTYESRLSGSVKSGKEGFITLTMPKSKADQSPAIFNQASGSIAFDSLRFELPTTFEIRGLDIASHETSLIHAESARARLMTLPPKKVSGVYFKEIELTKAVIHDYIRDDGSAIIQWGTDFILQITHAWNNEISNAAQKAVEEKAADVAAAAAGAGLEAVANDDPEPGKAMLKAAAEELVPKKKKPKDYFFSQRMFVTDSSIVIEDQKFNIANLAIHHINAEVGYRSIRKVLDYQFSLNFEQPVTTQIELGGQYSLPADKVEGQLVLHPLKTTAGFKKIQTGIQEQNAAHPEDVTWINKLLPSFNLDDTEIETSLKFAYDLKNEDLNLLGKLSIREFVCQFESLSKEPIVLSGSVSVDAGANLAKKDIRINGIDIDTDGSSFKLNAHLMKAPHQTKSKNAQGAAQQESWHFDIAADLPEQEMQTLFESIPHALRTELDGLTWSGKLGFHFEASGFLDSISEAQHKFSLVPSANFSVLKWPAGRNINALNNGFKFSVQDPNAQQPHEIAIPPSIYPVYSQDVAVYMPRIQREEVHQMYPDWVLFDDLNPWLIQLITTTEDGSFFSHQGFSPLQVKAALEKNISRNGFSRGASTISMQLVKNIFFDRSKTISRKFQEVLYTWLMESIIRIPKKRIMELYFNIIEFGPEIYGVEQAAKYYFGKRSSALSLKESAFLMAIIPNPRRGAVYRTQPTLDKWIQKTMSFYIQEMYRRKCDQAVLAKNRERLAKQGKSMVYEPCCPPRDSLQLMLDSDTLSFYIPNAEDPGKSAYRPDLYTPDGTPLSPVRTTNCGYHDDFENTEDAAESIFEAFVPAADLNDQN